MCNDPRIITEYEQNLAEQFLRNKMIADANSKGVIQEKNQVAINLLKEKLTENNHKQFTKFKKVAEWKLKISLWL